MRTSAVILLFPVIAAACADAPKSSPLVAPPAPTMNAVPLASAEPALSSIPATSAAPEVDASAPAVAEVQPDAGPHTPVCNEQAAQDFLIRKHYIPEATSTADEKKGAAEAHKQAVAYRTKEYGYVAGFGDRTLNPHSPVESLEDAKFMGLPVKMHKRVVPALACVEEAIKKECSDKPYTPRALAGIRYKNTFRGGEVTNHMYGIAIDIDPGLNSCCGCVEPWNKDPRCYKKGTPYERMGMPECWVHVFERYGFYWLGNDVLQDTMHFDFLGDPEKIMK